MNESIRRLRPDREKESHVNGDESSEPQRSDIPGSEGMQQQCLFPEPFNNSKNPFDGVNGNLVGEGNSLSTIINGVEAVKRNQATMYEDKEGSNSGRSEVEGCVSKSSLCDESSGPESKKLKLNEETIPEELHCDTRRRELIANGSSQTNDSEASLQDNDLECIQNENLILEDAALYDDTMSTLEKWSQDLMTIKNKLDDARIRNAIALNTLYQIGITDDQLL